VDDGRGQTCHRQRGLVVREEVAQRLTELNREFYREFAYSFAETRRAPQPGFYRLEGYLPSQRLSLLDVGCGEGRFGRFLLDRGRILTYEGVDASQKLLDMATTYIDGRFWRRDLQDARALDGLGNYDVVACLAVLQHIAGRDSRSQLIAEMGGHLAPDGRLLLSNWQFLSSERQRKKIVEWSEAGVAAESVEENDYLLAWNRDGRGLRYVAYIDETEIRALARQSGLRTIATFRSDGRGGDLNLYSIHEREG
jgi:tRNA (uracil-5-)-methyltransferase TRM9